MRCVSGVPSAVCHWALAVIIAALAATAVYADQDSLYARGYKDGQRQASGSSQMSALKALTGCNCCLGGAFTMIPVWGHYASDQPPWYTGMVASAVTTSLVPLIGYIVIPQSDIPYPRGANESYIDGFSAGFRKTQYRMVNTAVAWQLAACAVVAVTATIIRVTTK